MALIMIDGQTIAKNLSEDDLRLMSECLSNAVESGEDSEIHLENSTFEVVVHEEAAEEKS